MFVATEAQARRRHGGGEDPFPEFTYYLSVGFIGLLIFRILFVIWNRIRKPSRDMKARQDAARGRASRRLERSGINSKLRR